MPRLPDQDGVVARRQLLGAGLTPGDVRRLVRRRELTVVHEGVYVDHTGPLSWRQRAWAAVLWAWPAVLSGESALAAWGDSRYEKDGPIHVAVAHRRRIVPPPEVSVTRLRDFERRARWGLSPPRGTYEDAVLDVAAAASRLIDTVAVLADAVGSRRTTAQRLRARLDERSRMADRRVLERVLADIARGTHSVLEHGYLTLVERAHGLPGGRRQMRVGSEEAVRYRDVEVGGRVVIELDGRLHHDSARSRDRDLDRDLESALDGRTTVRLGWGQVFDRPCRTAARLAALFVSEGWRGTPRSCGPRCEAGSGSSGVTR